MVTDRIGDDEPLQDASTSESRQVQRDGQLQRHIGVAAEDRQIPGDPDTQSGDNLVTGNIPEEDGVEHRAEPATVEPTVWLTDGSPEDAPGTPDSEKLTLPGAPAGEADPLPAGDQIDDQVTPPDMPLPAAPYTADRQDTPPPGDGLRIPPYQRQVPPYPAQVSPYPAQQAPPVAPGVAARVTAPFAALTKQKTRKPAPPKPVPPAPPPPTPGPVAPAAAATATRPAPAERAATTARPAAAVRPAAPRQVPSTRRAQLVLARIEPWSVMKFSFMISLVGWVVLFVAVAALYYVLSKLGVFHSIQSTITSVTSGRGATGADANGQWFSASRILGYTMLVGAVNVILITALATVGAVIYNLVTHLAGGVEVTLKETD